MPTRVVHVRKSAFDLYIGRSFAEFPESDWANPFKVEPGCGRKCVIAKYRRYLVNERPDLMARLHEVRGLTLGCWCKDENGGGKPCHGDVIAELADALPSG
jgi:hypothetical protein